MIGKIMDFSAVKMTCPRWFLSSQWKEKMLGVGGWVGGWVGG